MKLNLRRFKVKCKKQLIFSFVTAFILAWGGQANAKPLEPDLSEQKKVEVTGVVKDAHRVPMSGVNVVQKGTTNGQMTDRDGKFRFVVSGDNPTLVFSFIGFSTVEEVAGNRTYFQVTLKEDVTNIDDVVVIGYGTTTRKEITGSVASLSSENFKSGNITDPLQLLQGQIAGLNITRPNGGDPNGGFEMQLRGLNTFTGGQGPLIVIDGVPGANLNNISPENIESIDVLKDGSAAAIYGTRGTNGVILVTTKKAKAGESSLEFSSYVAIQTMAKKPEVLTASEFRGVLKEFFPSMADKYDYGASTDWMDEITRSVPISQNYNLASSGGSHKLSYRANVSWYDDKGLIKKTSRNNLRARINVSQNLLKDDRLKIDYMMSYSTSKSSYADQTAMRQATLRNPTEPVYETEGRNPQYGKYYFNEGFGYHNPVAMIDQMDDESIHKEFSGSINASLRIIDQLKVNALVSISENSSRYGHYYGKYYPFGMGNNGFAETFNNHWNNKLLETTIEYSQLFNGHKVQLIGGYSFSEGTSENHNAMNYGFDTDRFSFYNIGAGSALKKGLASMHSLKESNRLISFFGRVMYNYKEKYLLSASVRYEGSSRFGKNNKWGTFPAVSLGWRLTQEEFMKDVKWLNEFKLRAGFGVTGNQDIGNYKSLPVLVKGGSNFYYKGKWSSIYQPGSNPNENLKWERKEEFNVGFDMSVLNGRLGASFDFYNRRTKDLLYTYEVPSPPNLYPWHFTNVGTIDNRGVELTINGSPVLTDKFKWFVVGTISRNTNKLVSFSNDKYEMTAIDAGYFAEDLKMYTMRSVEGRSIGNFWGPKFLGFDASGNAEYEDLDGVPGITDADNQVIGNAYPDFIFSIQNTFTYKNFDLSFLFRGSVGNDVLNQSRVYHEGFSYFGVKNILKSTLDHSQYKGEAKYSSRFVEDGSFLKLDNLTLGYSIPLKSSFVSKLRVYFTGQNLLTITGYKGIDPEVSLSGLSPGIDWFEFYPRTRTFVFGVNLVF